ncbi:hypothetical protein [Dyadobacter pollutisoli]|jgi:hypothetical protein|uniref:Uncharacterized protein n=1 Tax=Dyadobacter pollutisoli TaxID=2910158 RepID=A0A9E8NAX1_9BACT|nr:hypothetical protein [Dyadobacter pollutisoli]WAC11037.1 hypothetical protein ON006_25285 [Dyadobacter pollutisoli]
MKFTQYFLFTRERPDRHDIKLEWIEQVYNFPEKQEIQADGRIRRWAKIEENQKYLRIVCWTMGLPCTTLFSTVHLNPKTNHGYKVLSGYGQSSIGI